MSDKLQGFLKKQADDSKATRPQQLKTLWQEKEEYIKNVFVLFHHYYGARVAGGDISYGKRIERYRKPPLDKDKGLNEWVKSVHTRVSFFADNEQYQIKAFDSLLSLGYTPPEPLEITDHLLCLMLYYAAYAESMPLTLTMRIDFIMTRVVADAMFLVSLFDTGGIKKDNQRKGLNTIQAKMKMKIQYVVNSYYRSTDIKKGMKLNAVTKTIERELKTLNEKKLFPFSKVPSRDRIKAYLMADETIKRNFKKVGRYLIM